MAHQRSAVDPKLRTAIEEAARWSIRLQGGEDCPTLQAEWQHWLLASPDHRTAWTRLQNVQQRFSSVSAPIAIPTLSAAGNKRRRSLQLAVGGLVSAPLAWWLADATPWADWTADMATARGEVRSVALPDGSQLVLDTASAVDIAFDAQRRSVTLLSGKIYISTAHQTSERRPFFVQTRHGRIEALGTEFVVRATPQISGVQVNEHAVRITPRGHEQAAVRVDAGFAATFSSDGVAAPQPRATPDFAAWRHGSLIASEMPMSQLIEQLKAYQSGYLGLDPALADLKVSGVFPLSQTQLALAALENSHPVKVRHFTRYWTWVEPR